MFITRSARYLFKNLCRGTCYLNNGRMFSTKVITPKIENDKHIVWLDMEMTGLEVESCHIMELACLITDEHLSPVDDGLNLVIHQPEEILANMSDWCKVQHKKTDLIHDCQLSNITLEEAEETVLKYLEKHVSFGVCPLAGNSVYMDRMFLRKYMPLIDRYLHYRIIDVSSIREMARRWCPETHLLLPKKEYSHRAASDIKDSLNELHYYRKHLFLAK